MVISKNSQLGLMMDDIPVRIEFLKLMLKRNEDLAAAYDTISKIIQNKVQDESGDITITHEEIDGFSSVTGIGLNEEFDDISLHPENKNVRNKINTLFATKDQVLNFVDNEDSKLYLICEGVEKCSKMIRVGDNFSSKAFRNIGFGKHTYLLGKNEVCRFICIKSAIKGIYWNRSAEICFEFGFDLNDDGYFFDELYLEQFNKVAKIITFVELGDIDVIVLEEGRNNGANKKSGNKITNTSPFTVYVVDSSWNQLIIRTEGFAVMGHFRLQPCGAGLIDRKLIWINAFEKHGYKRQPKAKILHD